MTIDELKAKKAARDAAVQRERDADQKLAAASAEFTQRLGAARVELQKPVQAAHAEHADALTERRKAESEYEAAKSEFFALA